MDALRKAHANGQLEGVVPVDADGNTVHEYMQQLAGSVLNQAMPELMQQMGDRNPIMQAASGLFQNCASFHQFCFYLASLFSYLGLAPWLVIHPSKHGMNKGKEDCS